MQPVTDELYSSINEKGSQDGWNEWVGKWSKLSVEEFLRTNINGDLKSPSYRPWPEAAIRGLQVMIDFQLFKVHNKDGLY